MAQILVGVTGSVASIRVPALAKRLFGLDHKVRVVATEPALWFFDPSELDPEVPLFRDADERPVGLWRREDPILHIELRRWADLLILAPLDANTLAKIAVGLCDNLLTSLVRAWDFERTVILAPAMNALMWSNPVTHRHLRMILEDRGDGAHPDCWPLNSVSEIFAVHLPGIVLLAPQEKRLACGDVGVGGMVEIDAIVGAVDRWVSKSR